MTCPRCGAVLDESEKKAKTSPENRLFHALCAKLGMWKQVSADVIKRYVKLYAASAHNYPCESITLAGHTIIEPKSVAKATSEEMCILIDSAYEIGLDFGCQLEQPGGS